MNCSLSQKYTQKFSAVISKSSVTLLIFGLHFSGLSFAAFAANPAAVVPGSSASIQSTVDKVNRGNLKGIDTASFLADLENQIARKPGQDSWLEAAGILHFQLGHFDLARRALLKVKKPTAADDRMLALSLFEIKEYRKALFYFNRFKDVRLNRGDWEKYCLTLSAAGSKADALKEWEGYRARYSRTDAAGQVAGLDFLADYYRKPFQKELLIPILEAQLKRDKGTENEGKLLLELSTLYGETNLKAAELRAQYLKLHPEDFTAARGLATMYEARGEIAKAIPIFLDIAPHLTMDLKFNRHVATLLAKSDKEKAILFYEVCRTLAPKDFEIPLEIGRLQEALKRPELALESYKAVLDINPTQGEAKGRMVALAATSGASAAWLKTMVENEKKNPKDHAYQFQLAKLFLGAKDKDNAYKYLQKALFNSHDNETYAALLPQIISSDAQILKHFTLLQKLAVKTQNDPMLFILLGRGYSLYHNSALAADAYAKVLTLNPKLLEGHRKPILELFAVKNYSAVANLAEKYLVTDEKDADIRRMQVTALAETNAPQAKLRSAIQAFVKLEPYDDKWYLRLAELDLAAKDSAEALKHGHEWIKMHPDDKRGLLFVEPLAAKAKDAEVYFAAMDYLSRLDPANQNQYDLKTAYFLYEDQKYLQAADALGKLANAFPSDARFWNRYGVSQIKIGRDEAKAALEKAFRIEPTNPNYARDFGSILNSDTELKINLDVFQILKRSNPSKAEKQKLAHAYFLNGNFSSSAQEWDGLIAIDPELASKDSTAGMSYLKTNQLAKAKIILEKRLTSNPRDVGLLATMSDLYGKQGDSKKRMNAMERLVQEDQDVGDFALRLARDKEKAGLPAEAIALYSQWTFRHQDDVPSLKAYRDLAEKQKDTTALIEALRYLTLLKETERSNRFELAEVYFARSGETKELEDLVKTNPDYKQGKKLLVTEYHNKHAWDLLAGHEAFLVAESATNSDVLETLGDLYAHQKKITQAQQSYYSWLAVKRKDHEVFDKVYAYVKENAGPNLIAVLKMGTESFPQDLEIKANYAAALGTSRSALDVYQDLLTKQPGNEEAIIKAAEISKAIGDKSAEAKWSKRWSEIKPNDEKPWKYLIESLNPGSEKQKLADAYEGLVRLQPGNVEAILTLAKLQEELKIYDKAIGLYRNALYLNPKDKSVRGRLITIMKEKGKKEDLADVLTEIQNIDSSAHEAQFELAKLFLQKGDKNKAYAYLITALDQSPQNLNYQKFLPKVIYNREQTLKHFNLLMDIANRPETNRSDANNAELYLLLGHALNLQGKYEDAANFFAIENKIAPKNLVGDRDILIACYRGKNYSLAAELVDKYFQVHSDFDKEVRQIQILCYEKTMKDPALIRKTLQLLLAFDKENAGGQLRLAELDLRAKDTAAAINNIRNCLTTSPNEVRGYKMLLPLISPIPQAQLVTYVVVLEKLILLDTANRARHQMQLADFYFNRKSYKQTARLLSEVVEARPQDAEMWYRLGQCRNQLEVGDLGISCFKKAFDLQPSNLIFAHTFAQALQSPAEFKANLKLYQFVEDRGPSVHERFGLSMAYFYNGDFANSAKGFDRVVNEKAMEGQYIPEAALAYLRTNQPAKALPQYLLRLEHEANNLGLLDTLVHIYAKTNDEKGRAKTLESLVRVDATFKDYQLQLAQAKEKARDTIAAIDQYGQWTARNNKDATALKAMYHLAQGKGDTASLENALRLLVNIKGIEPEYLYQLAELQFKFTGETAELEKLVKSHPAYQRGRVILVKEYYRRFDLPKMIPFEKALAEQSTKEPELLGPLSELYAYQNKTESANKAFRDFLVYRKKSTGETANLELRQAFDKAWIYADANKSVYLKEILEIGNQSFPGEAPIQHALAIALNKDPRALELYKQILTKDDNDLVALKNGSELAMTLGKHAETVTWVERWSTLEPGSIRAWQLLGEAYTKLQNLPKAADALDHQTLLSPTDADLEFRTAKTYVAAKNREKALEFFIHASELKPKDPAYAFEVQDLLLNMTETLLAQGQIAKAVELYGLLLERDPTNKKANLYMGMWLTENHDYGAAEPILLKGIDQSSEPKPILAKAWRLLGECQSGQGKNKEALEDYKRALVLDPTDKAASLARLDLTRALNLANELAPALSDVVRIDSANIESAKSLAEIKMKDGDFASAVTLYRRVTSVNDREGETWGHYGEALEGVKRNSDALGAWDKAYALGDRTPYTLMGIAKLHRENNTLDKAENALDDLIVFQPDNDEANGWLADLNLSQGHYDKAEELYAQAAQDAPEKIEYTQGLANVYLQRGDAESSLEILEPVHARLNPTGRLIYAEDLRRVGKPELALPVYQEVYQKQPSARALNGIVDALLDKNKTIDAKHLIEISTFQNDPEVKHHMAKILLTIHDWNKATEILKPLVKENSSNAEYLYTLALTNYNQKKWSEAMPQFRSVLKLKPDMSLASFYIGKILLGTGQINEAREVFAPLAQMVSKSDRALGLYGLGLACLSEKKPGEALEFLLQAADVYPTSEILASLSEVHLQLGHDKDAEEAAQKSLESDEDFAPGLVALAEVMLSQNHKDEARDFLKEALTRNPKVCEVQLELNKSQIALENFQSVATNGRQLTTLCPEEPQAYFYVGIALDKTYQKKQAEEFFKGYLKYGGDKLLLPKGY